MSKVKDEEVGGLVEGVSSAHSWIKAQTMIRPTKLGAKKRDEDDEDGEEDNEIQITLTSRNPNDSFYQVWWIHDKGEYKQVAFQESMIDHLEIESSITLVTKDQTSEVEIGENDEKTDGEDVKRANHFAFLERATQTKVYERLESESQTDPPPISEFCDTVSPSIVYDHFLQKDKEATERDAMELDLIKDISDNNKVETDKTQQVEKKLLNAAKIMERVLNLNTYEDVARDFRFYEDPADEFRAPEGSFSFYNNLQVGYVCIYSLKNPSYPEYICRASSGIISFDIHPSHPNMVVVGLYNGNVAVYNLRSSSSQPCFTSCAATGKHQDVVWQVKWVADNLDGYLNFYSVAGDGRVTNWTIVKTTLWHSDKLVLKYSKQLSFGDDLADHLVEGPRAIAFKPDDENIFLVGTEEGDIHLATTEFSTQFLMTYRGHATPVNAVTWNPHYPCVFLSCAAEYTVNVWHKDHPSPLVMYDLGSQVGDVAWAPYSSTVFAAVTVDGRAVVFDLSVNKYSPICNQKVLSSSQGSLNRLAFNPDEPLLIIGDSLGMVHAMKLSPNLRKKDKKTIEALRDNNVKLLKKLEYSKLDEILSQVIPKNDAHT